jgi:hypothetical protein
MRAIARKQKSSDLGWATSAAISRNLICLAMPWRWYDSESVNEFSRKVRRWCKFQRRRQLHAIC